MSRYSVTVAPKLAVQIEESKEHPGSHNLFVNGHLHVRDESLGVCEAVEHALIRPPHGSIYDYSEADEVADRIRATLEAQSLNDDENKPLTFNDLSPENKEVIYHMDVKY